MQVGYVVDVHGRFDSVVEAVSRMGRVDVLVVGGDITSFGTPADAERAIELWRPLVPRLLAVAGNCDSPAIDECLAELGVSIDGRGVMVEQVGLFGASAAPSSPLRTPYEVADSRLSQRASAGLADLADAGLLVFCPHAPPYGTKCDRLRSGEHVGSRALREFVVSEQPHVVLCGHIHEARAEDTIDQARIVNPGPVTNGHYAVIDVEEDGPGFSVALD